MVGVLIALMNPLDAFCPQVNKYVALKLCDFGERTALPFLGLGGFMAVILGAAIRDRLGILPQWSGEG